MAEELGRPLFTILEALISRSIKVPTFISLEALSFRDNKGIYFQELGALSFSNLETSSSNSLEVPSLRSLDAPSFTSEEAFSLDVLFFPGALSLLQGTFKFFPLGSLEAYSFRDEMLTL